uniref:Uncharacterized protein n=1 Tax=Arundo donax TaxID=35708 RepID=A0A0A8YM82_ARUDO
MQLKKAGVLRIAEYKLYWMHFTVVIAQVIAGHSQILLVLSVSFTATTKKIHVIINFLYFFVGLHSH